MVNVLLGTGDISGFPVTKALLFTIIDRSDEDTENYQGIYIQLDI